jgi:hypothetical protein
MKGKQRRKQAKRIKEWVVGQRKRRRNKERESGNRVTIEDAVVLKRTRHKIDTNIVVSNI